MQKVRDAMFIFKLVLIIAAFVLLAALVMTATHPSAGTSVEIAVVFLLFGGFVALKEVAKYRR
jgi:hypothetical protein